MVLTLVRKELRETRAFAVVSLLSYLVYLSNLTGVGGPMARSLVGLVPGMVATPPDIPFVQDNFGTMLFFIGTLLAIALGFRQSAWEPSQGTALYLLHLPLGRRTIVLTKLLIGVVMLLACTLAPILIYATWASQPRTHPGPFEWGMVDGALRIWILQPLVYLGAFASGIRPARWFGSRMLPLASAFVPMTLAFAIPFWWLIGLPILCMGAAMLLSDILWEIETRDF
jgi:hypothetical protein